MQVRVSKWGNSLAVRLPKELADRLRLAVGQSVDLEIEDDGIMLKPKMPAPRYRLEDLLADMDRLGPENHREMVDWGPDVGAEIIEDDYSRPPASKRKRPR